MLKNILINSLLDNNFNLRDLYNKIKKIDLNTIIKELIKITRILNGEIKG